MIGTTSTERADMINLHVWVGHAAVRAARGSADISQIGHGYFAGGPFSGPPVNGSGPSNSLSFNRVGPFPLVNPLPAFVRMGLSLLLRAFSGLCHVVRLRIARFVVSLMTAWVRLVAALLYPRCVDLPVRSVVGARFFAILFAPLALVLSIAVWVRQRPPLSSFCWRHNFKIA